MLCSGLMKEKERSLNRRQFLKVLSAGAGVALLGGVGFLRSRSLGPLESFSAAESLLGTWVTITVHHNDKFAAKQAVANAFEAIRGVDRVMSLHRTDSDLTKLNGHAGEMVSVDPSLIQILQTTHLFHTKSGGVYDVSCLPLMRMYGFYRSNQSSKHYPSDAEIAKTLSLVNQRYISLDTKKNRAGLLRPGMGVDLGSIGKGYAVDRAGDALRKAGIQNALVDAGGNILAIGAPHGNTDTKEGWQVAIRNPFGGAAQPYFETLTLRDQAVATSGNYEQSICLDGNSVGHLLNAITGKPENPGISATVVADNATIADALSTSVFLLEPSHTSRLKDEATAIYFHQYDKTFAQPKC